MPSLAEAADIPPHPPLADSIGSLAVGDLPLSRDTLPWEASGEAVEHTFNDHPELPGLLVMQDGALAGLLCRARFMELMTHPFAPELYLHWPLSRLPANLWIPPLIVDRTEPVADAVAKALSRPAGQTYDPLVVRLGSEELAVLDMHALLLAEGQILAGNAASLQRTLSELRRTQDNLVEARKMAALGGLVAGVAHEINTPLGLSLTSATHLREQTAALAAKLRDGSIKRSELDRYFALAEEVGGHLEVNLQRAAEMIRNFKQVAVDQTSRERRSFALRPYIDSVVSSLHPRLKKLPHRLEIDCPDDLKMDSYPGALAQILSNLILNAVIHAFPDGQAGRIGITAQREEDMVAMTVSDDGTGIPPENLPRIFDPFFTTRRGEGGSGLGLNIVFNLTTQALGGTIRCDSAPGQGTAFRIRLPLQGPTPS